MTLPDIASSKEWEKAVDFHGHVCPGLAIGFRAASMAMEWLKEHKAEDEELVAIVETNSCGADAIQALTGCTFGKGNFFHLDHGKHVYSVVSRRSGNGVRVSLRAGAFQPNERHWELIQKTANGTASDEERKEFRNIHEGKSYEILGMNASELFALEPTIGEIPPRAKLEVSKICELCGEPAMSSRIVEKEGLAVCLGCSKKDITGGDS